ncbi:MAG: N-acetylmuramic acid 6-phosphate etherase [Proteobacteria bacterium]|nr:N-acetylmuramic acid 6-phosphate etherase [Pseudomonadota bacterium]
MSKTETVSARYATLDLWPTADAVEAMFEGQLSAAAAVRSATGAIAAAAEAAADRLRNGRGRLVYVGAGTSGRIAVQDGVELGPTFDWPEDRFVYLLAGGKQAITTSVEDAEDDADDGRKLIVGAAVSAHDVVIGVAASGQTRFTVAAVEQAHQAGALTIGIAGNPDTSLLITAEHAILLPTGEEVIAGSTRMKAGTAQKIALNLLSTAIMLRLGLVHGNLMVAMRSNNKKLVQRALDIVQSIAGGSTEAAKAALIQSDGDIRTAVLVARGFSLDDARAQLSAAGGVLRQALPQRK